MTKYLVEASCQRVAAYRSYREQIGTYWTMRRLERLQWEFLYGFVTIDSKYGGKNRHILPQREFSRSTRIMLDYLSSILRPGSSRIRYRYLL